MGFFWVVKTIVLPKMEPVKVVNRLCYAGFMGRVKSQLKDHAKCRFMGICGDRRWLVKNLVPCWVLIKWCLVFRMYQGQEAP